MNKKIDTLVVVGKHGNKVFHLKKIIEKKPKTKEEIKTKLKELLLVRGQLVKEDKTDDIITQLTAVNNQIMMLHWVLGEEK